MHRIGKETVKDAERNLMTPKNGKVHINSGKLFRSIAYTVQDGQLAFQMEKYGEYVDKGRKPGKWAPVDVIQAWVMARKLVIRGGNLKEYLSKVKSVAYLINKHIKEHGIKPTYFFTDAYDQNTEDMDALIEELLEEFGDELEDV